MISAILVVIVVIMEVRLLMAEVMEASWSVVRESVMLNDMMVFACSQGQMKSFKGLNVNYPYDLLST